VLDAAFVFGGLVSASGRISGLVLLCGHGE
jgi:hypothetical protein